VILYKYINEDRVSILENGLIRFTQPQGFNDPFELKLVVERLASDSHITETISSQFEQMIEDEYKELPDTLKNVLTYDQLLAFSITKKKGVIDSVLAQTKTMAPGLNALLNKKLEESMGVLCLTEDESNLLMWAHYANSHKGCVIGFDSDNSFFNQKKSEDDELRHLRKVIYTKERRKLDFMDLDDMTSFLSKGQEWRYEEEWRMLCALDDSDVVKTASPDDIHLFRLPFSSIVSLTFGARASINTIRKVLGLVRDNNDLTHIALSKMEVDDREYKLVKNKINI
jgi:hypothetical protein